MVPCFVSTLLEDIRDDKGETIDKQRDFDIRWTANSMYSASMDTVGFNAYSTVLICIDINVRQTITVVQHFLLAMITHPECFKKAQKEIDTVVGRDRLPTFEDRPSLPYLECIMSEVLRWGVPVPLGEPRRSVQFFVTSSDLMQGFPTA